MKDQIRHYAEEILRILDEEEAEIIEDEVPVESTPEPIPEPVKPEPVKEEIPEPTEEKTKDPIRGFKAEIVAHSVIQCSWIPQADGKIDIEFYKKGVNPKTGKRYDRDWHHSVNKYLKIFIPISDMSYKIWVREEDTGEGYLFRAKKAQWSIFGIDLFTWYSDPVMAVYPTPEPIVVPEPVKEEPIIEPVKEEKPEPIIDEVIEPVIEQPTKPVQIALAFHNNYNVDVWLNGELIPKERPFDYSFSNPVGPDIRVKLVWIDTFKTLLIEPSQINHETFAYKLINRDRDSDLSKINANHTGDVGSGDIDFWGEPARDNPLGIIVSKHGDTRYDTRFPYPEFYKGFPDDPVNNPDDLSIHPQWSTNGKIVLNLGI